MTESDCRFGILGPLLLERAGRPVAVPSGHPRSLLALFLMAGGVPLSRDRLIDELWGERPPATAVSALHVHLSKLRDLLGDLLVREPSGYSLRAGDFELDCWEFDALVDQARLEPDRALAEVIDQARRHGVHSVAVAALWFVARYAAEVDPRPLGAGWHSQSGSAPSWTPGTSRRRCCARRR